MEEQEKRPAATQAAERMGRTIRPKGKKRRRLGGFPGWLVKLTLVPFFLFCALILGMYVGYSVIGGQPGKEVFDWETWKHMYDLIFAEG
ncbi:hypothetical protein BSNK01_17590 [Bacillaceae bacterium]